MVDKALYCTSDAFLFQERIPSIIGMINIWIGASGDKKLKTVASWLGVQDQHAFDIHFILICIISDR